MLGTARRAWGGALTLVVTLLAPAGVAAAAAPPAGVAAVVDPPAEGYGTGGSSPDTASPHGVVEFGMGILVLPDAEVCGVAGCDRGDLSVELDAWPLFRASPRFAVGAGLTLALTPTQDVPQGEMAFRREHSRRYFLVETVGRYYFVHGRDLEIWGGVSTGLVVVSDNFRSAAKNSAGPIGAAGANIATEGLTLGLATGFTLGITRSLQVGASLRVANWLLPSRAEVIAFGEEASLSNRVTMVGFGLTVAYHGS